MISRVGLYFALPVPPGEHVVTLAYRAPRFRLGLAIAAAWWLAVALRARRRPALS